jgi:hypothetical protein
MQMSRCAAIRLVCALSITAFLSGYRIASARIVVPASGLGNPQPGRQLKAFLTRIRLDGGAVLVFPDSMPNSAAPAGTYTVTSCGQ